MEGWLFMTALVAAWFAVFFWHRQNIRRWTEIADKPDNSLAGAMERSRKHAARK